MKIYAYITGGGAQWIADKLSQGGASSWFLGARVPYSQKDFDSLIGGEPWDKKYVSSRTVGQLAVAAYNHAQTIDSEGVGFAVTASLHKKGERKERENHAYMALYNGEGIYERHITFRKLFTSRRKQELILAREMESFLKDFAANRVYGYFWDQAASLYSIKQEKVVLYSGSFNPFHAGHSFVYNRTREALPDYDFYFEITRRHYNKPSVISPSEYFGRIFGDIFEWTKKGNCVYSSAPTFVEKARVLLDNGVKSLVFVMGDDVYEKISETDKNTLDSWGVKLLVFLRGKEKVDGHPVLHPATFTLPKLPYDISSTELRKKK